MADRIDILLAVYQGERYLGAQIDSLMRQGGEAWRILARDDGSTDGSRAVLEAHRRRYPGRLAVLDDGGGHLGVRGNFSALLASSSAEYSMLCDQDDIWRPDKVARTLAVMKRIEGEGGGDRPLLVHTDLEVVDGDLRVIAKSLWRHEGSDPSRGAALNRLLVQNCVTGCSVMINRRLRELALPVPAEAMMHDWWLALVAAAFGGIGYLDEATAAYRQHGGNETGARPWNTIRKARQLLEAGSRRALFEERAEVEGGTRAQARVFLERYAGRLTPRRREIVEHFARLDTYPWLTRKRLICRYGFFGTGLIRNLARLVLA